MNYLKNMVKKIPERLRKDIRDSAVVAMYVAIILVALTSIFLLVISDTAQTTIPIITVVVVAISVATVMFVVSFIIGIVVSLFKMIPKK